MRIKMKIDFTSDTHLDVWVDPKTQDKNLQKNIKNFTHKVLCADGGDVLILAGDLGHYFHQNIEFLKYVKSIYNDVLLVTGNHDLYLVSNKQEQKYKYNSWNRVQEMKDFCLLNNIKYLDGNTVKINGIIFGGVGMSWDCSFYDHLVNRESTTYEILNLFKSSLSDSSLIMQENYNSYIESGMYSSSINIRFNPFEYFRDEFKKLRNIESADVMISHYGPVVPEFMPLKYSIDKISTFFFFDGLNELKRINPEIWIFGHTHNKYNFRVQNTELMCSPLGYPGRDNNLGSVRSFDM